MKTLRLFGMVLMTVLLSVSFAACGDDDDDDNNVPTATELVGTTWRGTSSSWNGYYATVTFTSTSECTVKVYDNSGNLDEQETCAYSYNVSTGVCSCPEYGVTGTIKGNKMSLNSSELGGSFTMTKQ